jgi:TRAP-type mannitol/chloroaromatic compound transport system substrate-binding protein
MDRRKFLKGAAIASGAATAASLATPAIAQSRKEMVIVSTWPRDFPGLGTSAQRLAARISELSEGRIATQYFAAGERVGAFDVFDEVASGNARPTSAPTTTGSASTRLGLLHSVPFGLTYAEANAWIKFKGGQALWDELSGVRPQGPALRRNRHPDGRLVQQGNQFARRPQGPEDAYSRPRRRRDGQAWRIDGVAAGRPDL